MSCSTLSYLPQEILLQILSKLPAKSLVRFKCVSKFFCSLMVDHPFADLHCTWSLTLPCRISILIFFPLMDPRGPITNWYYTINYPEETVEPECGALEGWNTPSGVLQHNRLHYMDDYGELFKNDYYLRSAVNGLLCFCRYPPTRHRDDIVIHNLSTRHHISLPSTYCTLPLNSDQRMNVCGLLGFDSVSRRYKVLKSVQFIDQENHHVTVKHCVFTLGVDKSWREIDDCSPSFHPYNCFHPFYFRTSLHIDGIIYSRNSLHNNDYSWSHIVAFDVADENFCTIPSPNRYLMLQDVGLIEVDGRLGIVDSRKSNMSYFMQIWTLEESMEWKKMHTIPIPIPLKDCQSPNINKRNLLFFGTNHIGEIAVLAKLTNFVAILFYNFKTQSWRKFYISEFLSPVSKGTMWSIAIHFIVDNIF